MGKKRKARKTTVDFISIRGQQNFEDNAEINHIEVKIENGKIQNMFEKFLKTRSNSLSKGCFFQVKKISLTTNGLIDAKYDLINRKLYQTIGAINLNKIKN